MATKPAVWRPGLGAPQGRVPYVSTRTSGKPATVHATAVGTIRKRKPRRRDRHAHAHATA